MLSAAKFRKRGSITTSAPEIKPDELTTSGSPAVPTAIPVEAAVTDTVSSSVAPSATATTTTTSEESKATADASTSAEVFGEFDSLWDKNLSLVGNVKVVLEGYLPTSFPIIHQISKFFKHEENINAVNFMTSSMLKGVSENDAADIYFKCMLLKDTFKPEKLDGGYNKRLSYLIDRIEKTYPDVKGTYVPPTKATTPGASIASPAPGR